MSEILTFTEAKGQSYTLTVQPLDDDGNPAALVSPPVWTVSDPTVFSLAPSADGLSCVATSLKAGFAAIKVDAVGTVALQAEADGTVTLPLATRLLLTGKAS